MLRNEILAITFCSFLLWVFPYDLSIPFTLAPLHGPSTFALMLPFTINPCSMPTADYLFSLPLSRLGGMRGAFEYLEDDFGELILEPLYLISLPLFVK